MQEETARPILNLSVSRAFAILECLANAASPQELSSVCKTLKMNKSTTYRFLTTLESLGYVDQDLATDRYRLGARVAWLASKFLDAIDLRAVARPMLLDLRDATNETTHLAVLDNFDVVYIDKVDGKSSLRMASSVGDRMPAHATGLGKVLMAFMPEAAWKSYVERVGLFRRTQNTITEPVAFYEELTRIRERGFSIDNAENEDGIRCVAIPVRDHTGNVVAAISIAGWAMSMRPDRDDELAALGRKYASALSAKLGYPQQQLVISETVHLGESSKSIL